MTQEGPEEEPKVYPTSRDALQEAMISEFILPTLPLVAEALQDMIGKRGKTRDMKAAYLVAEVARDLVLKGLTDGPTLSSVIGLVQDLKKRIDAVDKLPGEDEESPSGGESLLDQARRASQEGQKNGNGGGRQGLAELTPRATDDLGATG